MASIVERLQNALFNYGYRQQGGETGHIGSWGTREGGVTEAVQDFLRNANPINPPKAGAYEGGGDIAGAAIVGAPSGGGTPYNPPSGGGQPQPTASSDSRGYTGEEIRAMGMNPDTMTSQNGLYYLGGGSAGGYDADAARRQAEEQAQRALEAAIGTFNTKAQGLRNRIPGVEAARDLRVRGLDEDLSQFLQTSEREQGSRVGDLGETRKTTEDLYTTAERKTRASAKSLARNLRNLFAGAGSLDSTQYRDYNIEQSKEIAQSLGDTRREGAGKLSSIDREIEDIKSFYGEQANQFTQKTALAKDKARAEADAEIQGIMDDIQLTDAQKIEAVVAQQGKLDDRLSRIDELEVNYKQQREKDAEETAIKLAELQQKGYSDSYKSTQANQKAFDSATSVIKRLSDQLGGMTPDTAATVFTQYGFDEEKAKQLAQQFYGGAGEAGTDSIDQDILRRFGVNG